MPPIEYWISVKAALFVTGFIFGCIVSFVGVSVMKLSRRYAWALTISGGVFVGLSLWDAADTKFKADNFCYFEAILNQRKGDGYEWRLHNRQQRVLPFEAMCRDTVISSQDKKYEGCWEKAACLPETINQTTAGEKPIMPGIHLFTWHAENGWNQTLKIVEEPNFLVQTGVIFRNGKEVWRFEEVLRKSKNVSR